MGMVLSKNGWFTLGLLLSFQVSVYLLTFGFSTMSVGSLSYRSWSRWLRIFGNSSSDHAVPTPNPWPSTLFCAEQATRKYFYSSMTIFSQTTLVHSRRINILQVKDSHLSLTYSLPDALGDSYQCECVVSHRRHGGGSVPVWISITNFRNET